MSAVIECAGLTVRRGGATLLDDVDWTVEEDERWVLIGPNGAGKTTLLQVASAQLHPTAGVAGHPRRGARHRRRLRPAPAHRADQRRARRPHPARRAGAGRRRVRVVRRARPLARGVRHARPRPGRGPAPRGRRRPPGRPHLRHPQRGRAQARPDRPRADDRPRAAAARRAGRRPRPRRPRGPRVHAERARPRPRLAGDGPGLPPRRGDPAGLHPRDAAARRAASWRRVRWSGWSPRRRSPRPSGCRCS